MIKHVTFIIFQVMQDDSFAHLQHVILFHVRNYTTRNIAYFSNNTTRTIVPAKSDSDVCFVYNCLEKH